MSFRVALLILLILLNLLALRFTLRSAAVWIREPGRLRWTRRVIVVIFIALNLPLTAFFIRPLDLALLRVPTRLLEVAFYPSTAWLAALLGFFLLVALPVLVWKTAASLVARISRISRVDQPVDPRRRELLTGGAGLLVPAMYGIASYGTYGSIHDLDISREIEVAIPNLPRGLDGLAIAQVSDLHVGPYIREKELRHIVEVVNGLQPDLVVITGDVIDRYLASLPDAVRGLSGFKSALGVYAILGNHDIYADRYSYDRRNRGGVRIAEGLLDAGIRTLRNDVAWIGGTLRDDSLALMGLDWISAGDTSGSYFNYNQQRTRQALRSMAEQVHTGAATVLLAHHPDTFDDARALGVGLTLSGHTHGGGQVLLGTWNGVPLGIAVLRFKYLSGLYREGASTLYVNRGIGYLGVPIRLNCPPEISRFRLVCRQPDRRAA